MATISSMSELPGPGLMTLTRTVPGVVPLVFQSCDPCSGSSATKKVVGPAAVN